MPQNAVNYVEVDHVVPIALMGALLERLVHRRPTKVATVPSDIAIEAKLAERVLSDLGSVNALGDQVPALRMFEERRNLLRTMSSRKGRGYLPSAAERADEAAIHIDRIRDLLRASDLPNRAVEAE